MSLWAERINWMVFGIGQGFLLGGLLYARFVDR